MFNPYIGLKYLPDEEIIVFIDNTIFNYSGPPIERLYSWLPGEPNNVYKEGYCIQLLNRTIYGLNDVKCGMKNYAICELKNITCV